MILVMLNGFAFSAIFALSQAFYSRLVPRDQQGQFFSVYVLFEKFASVLGPLVWALALIVFAPYGDIVKYRFAMASLAILVAVGAYIMRRVQEPVQSQV